MADNALSEIINGETELFTDPEHQKITAVKAKTRPVGKVTVGVVNHGVLESSSSQTYMPVEPVEFEKVYHTIPQLIKDKYKKGKTERREAVEARDELMERMDQLKMKKKRLMQLAAARAAKGASK
jgi:hypothetical protein